MVKTFSFAFPFLTGYTQVSNIFGVVRGEIYTKIGLAMGVTIGFDADKSGKNTHMLVVMRGKPSQKIGLIDLKNQTRFKKGSRYKICTKSVHNYWGMCSMINTRYIHY